MKKNSRSIMAGNEYAQLLHGSSMPTGSRRSDVHYHSTEQCTGRSPHPDHQTGIRVIIDEGEDVSMSQFCSWCAARFFTKEKLARRLPIIDHLSRYSWKDFQGDLIAGISVTFTLVPQALAYATLAGLHPQYGLYSSFVGCFLYALFGSCKDVAFGPTSIMAIVIAPYVAHGGAQYSILLAFLAGIVQLMFGLLNLGFVIDFVSFPVISSFISAASLTIAASQLKGFFGMTYSAPRFRDMIWKFFAHLMSINPLDFLIGSICLAFLIPLHLQTRRVQIANTQNMSRWKRIWNGFWFTFVTGRNAIVIVLGAVLVQLFGISDRVTLIQKITPGLPIVKPPSFDLSGNFTGNDGVEVYMDTQRSLTDLNPGLLVVALLGLLETVAVAQAFTQSNRKLDATQEMIALGICNIVNSFMGGMPSTGAFSRSAVNNASGVRTPLAGLLTGSLVIVILSQFTALFHYVPQASLCALVITAVIFVLKPKDALLVWSTNKVDIIPYVATFGSSLILGLEFGIMAGVAVSLSILLYQMARPKISIFSQFTPEGYPFLYVKPDRSVFFPSIEYMKIKINKALEGEKENPPIPDRPTDPSDERRSQITFNIPEEGQQTPPGSFNDRNGNHLFQKKRNDTMNSVGSTGVPNSSCSASTSTTVIDVSEIRRPSLLGLLERQNSHSGSTRSSLLSSPQRTAPMPTVPVDHSEVCVAPPKRSVAVVIDGEHMFRADSTFAVGIKNMTAGLRAQGVICIFYNVRRSVLRSIRGVSLRPGDEFHHCRNEREIYSIIRVHHLKTCKSNGNIQSHNDGNLPCDAEGPPVAVDGDHDGSSPRGQRRQSTSDGDSATAVISIHQHCWVSQSCEDF